MTGYSSVTECFSSGTVTGNNYVGGISGYDNYTSYNNCYSKSGITSYDHYSGGFIGYTKSTSANRSYSCGSVNGFSDFGGFVGFDFFDMENFSIFTSCYWDTQASGLSISAAGEGRTTDEMTFEHDANTYLWWDFNSPVPTWEINYGVNGGYPYLTWQNMPNTNFAGGKGTEEEPYLVSNAAQLNNVRYYLTKAFRQTADIDLGVSPWNDGIGWDPISTGLDETVQRKL
jgi:hypothetical protein